VPYIHVIGFYEGNGGEKKITENFERQSHNAKDLTLISKQSSPSNTINALETKFEGNNSYFAVFDSDWFYGEHYLTDLLNSFSFASSETQSTTKATYFKKEGLNLNIKNASNEYRYVPSFSPHASLMKSELLDQVFPGNRVASSVPIAAMSIDKYNLCHMIGDTLSPQEVVQVADLRNVTLGSPLSDILVEASEPLT